MCISLPLSGSLSASVAPSLTARLACNAARQQFADRAGGTCFRAVLLFLAVVVAHGAAHPQVTFDGTAVNVGTEAIGSTKAGVPLSFTVLAGTRVGSVSIVTGGAEGKDFADAGGSTCTAQTYTTTTQCQVNVSFTPLGAGVRSGAVVLRENSGKPLATGFVYGTGTGPEVAFSPGAPSSLEVEPYIPDGLAVDGAGDLFVASVIADDGYYYADFVEYPLTSDGYGSPVSLAFNPRCPCQSLNNSVAVDGAGNVFSLTSINDELSYQLWELPWTGKSYAAPVAVTYGLPPNVSGGSLAVDRAGNLYVNAVTHGGEILEFPWNGNSYDSYLVAASGLAGGSLAIAVDGDRNLFYTTAESDAPSAISEVPWTGTDFGKPQSVLATGLTYAPSLSADSTGNLFTADEDSLQVLELPRVGKSFGPPVLRNFPPQTENGKEFVSIPVSIAADASGKVYVGLVPFNSSQPPFSPPATIAIANRAEPSMLDFGTPTKVGTTDTKDGPRTETLTNIGSAMFAADISYPPNFAANTKDAKLCGNGSSHFSLAPGASCDVSVTFTPTDYVEYYQEIELISNNLNGASVYQAIALQGRSLTATGALTSAADATTGSTSIPQSDDLLVTGWAAVLPGGGPASQVTILIDGNFVGNATLGLPRTGAADRDATASNTGWSFTLPAAGLTTGTHTVHAVAYNAHDVPTNLGERHIIVIPSQ